MSNSSKTPRPKLFTARDVSRLAGISDAAMHAHVIKKHIEAYKVGVQWIIFEDEVDRWLATRGVRRP